MRPGAPADAGGVNRFRPEIQGLRSLAVLMVVVYHVFLDRISGGVDVFLMISAFLLTLAFVRREASGRPFDLAGHWLHRFKRLIPAAAATILGTLVAAWVWLPASRWSEVVDEAWASLLYVQNWHLIAGIGIEPASEAWWWSSPLVHFWSLSVQGQVFILWPILLVGAAWVARRSGRPYRAVIAVAFGLVFVTSLVFSIRGAAVDPYSAYFDTRARLWEFAAGSLLALASPFVRLGSAVRVLMGWVGVVAMLVAGVAIPEEEPFPGYVALWPVLAAALVITAGQTGSRAGADRVLGSRPLAWLGGRSYALFLVHFPVLAIYLSVVGEGETTLAAGLVVIAVSIALAALVTAVVEEPLRRAAWTEGSRLRSAAVVVGCLVAVALPLGITGGIG